VKSGQEAFRFPLKLTVCPAAHFALTLKKGMGIRMEYPGESNLQLYSKKFHGKDQ
jgi:hypothetical protein